MLFWEIIAIYSEHVNPIPTVFGQNAELFAVTSVL
jgi:hypothetical protein